MNTRNNTVHVVQGEHHVSDDPDVVITTVLGSCVAACIYDPVCRVGGMNHFLLPLAKQDKTDIRYAAAAIESLVNALLRRGARRERLEAKLFGGARMLPSLPDIGRQNAEAAQRILQDDGIRVVSGDLCGSEARRIRFWPTSGRVQMQLLGDEAPPSVETPRRPAAGDIELF